MNHGDVVLLDWPYSNLSGAKFLRAVVMQAGYANGPVDDTTHPKVSGQHIPPALAPRPAPPNDGGAGILRLRLGVVAF
jgi:hypothetical protein